MKIDPKQINRNIVDYMHRNNAVQKTIKKKTIKNLFLDFYVPANILRKLELLECLKNNINCDQIDKIFLICEMDIDDIDFKKLIVSDKIVTIVINKRPKLKDLIDFINYIYEGNETFFKDYRVLSIVSNSDIYFDCSLALLDKLNLENKALALSRYDKTDNGWILREKSDSQDTWIFQDKIKELYADFYLGQPGVDNRFLWEMKRYYKVFDFSYDIKSYHIHSIKIKNDNNVVSRPYDYIVPVSLENHLETQDYYEENLNIEIDAKEKFIYLGIGTGHQIDIAESFENYCKENNLNFYKFELRSDVFKYNLKKILMSKNIKYIFVQAQSDRYISKLDLLNIIDNNRDVKIINFTGDVRDPIPEWYIEWAELSNIYTFFTNQNDVNEFNRLGLKAYHIHMAVDKYLYNPSVIGLKIQDIIFTGNHYHNRFPLSEYRLNLVKFLINNYKMKFGLYGNGWLKENIKSNGFLKGTSESAGYKGSKIVVGCNHFDYENYTSGRLFRVMGCNGAIYMPKYFKGIENMFENHKHLVWWKDLSELKENIDYYLKNEKEREVIAHNGYVEVYRNHNYKLRIKEFINKIKEGQNEEFKSFHIRA